MRRWIVLLAVLMMVMAVAGPAMAKPIKYDKPKPGQIKLVSANGASAVMNYKFILDNRDPAAFDALDAIGTAHGLEPNTAYYVCMFNGWDHVVTAPVWVQSGVDEDGNPIWVDTGETVLKLRQVNVLSNLIPIGGVGSPNATFYAITMGNPLPDGAEIWLVPVDLLNVSPLDPDNPNWDSAQHFVNQDVLDNHPLDAADDARILKATELIYLP